MRVTGAPPHVAERAPDRLSRRGSYATQRIRATQVQSDQRSDALGHVLRLLRHLRRLRQAEDDTRRQCAQTKASGAERTGPAPVSPLTDRPLGSTRGGSGEPMVLIHGIGSSAEIWDRVRVPLEQRFDVIAVDLPGFGDQPWFSDPVPERMDSLATAVAEELDRLGIERAHLLGHSMGGWIALELARRGRAIDVRRGRSRRRGHPSGGAGFQTGADRLAGRGAGLCFRSSGTITRRPRCAGSLLRGSVKDPDLVDPAELETSIRYLARSVGHDKLLPDVAGPGDLIENNREGFGRIDCPVLIAWGTEDGVLSYDAAPRVAEAIPGAELRTLRATGTRRCSTTPSWSPSWRSSTRG